jgi:hypothetical protein
MASEDEANKARERHRRDLLAKGAHAVGVEPGSRHGKRGWVLVAHVPPNARIELPSSLSCRTSKGEVDVPLVVAHGEPFAPE